MKRLPTLLYWLALFGLAGKAFASTEENKFILLPREYSYCSISPEGRYVAIHRRVLDSMEKFAKPEGPAIFRTRIYILDLETNKLVLAGPPDKPGRRRNSDDWVDQAKWAVDGNLLLLTNSELMSVDPATGKPLTRINIHATLRKEISLPLQDSLDKPLLFYDINWSRGASVTLYSLTPSTGKIRRFAKPGIVNDLSVRITHPWGNQALSLRAYTKGTDQGYTWELDEAGELQVYPLNLETEWREPRVAETICRQGERILIRHLESGDAVGELRLFNYRSNEFVGASVQVPREMIDIASALLTATSVDRIRATSGSLDFQEVALQPVLSLVNQLRKAYPLASVRIANTTADGNKIALSVSAQNRPAAYFVFDMAAGKLQKVMECGPDWAERTLAPSSFVEYASPAERGGKGVASFISAIEASPSSPTVIRVSAEAIYDFDWGFSSTNRFLSAEGFNTLHITLPWSLQLTVAQASSTEEFASAMLECSDFLETALRAAQEQAELGEVAHYVLHGSAAAMFPSLPQVEGVKVENVFIANPRFHSGLAGISLARMKNLEQFPFKRYIDPKTWRSLAGHYKPELDAPVTVIWRENDVWWDQENGAEEQIKSFELYCQDVGADFELDRWREGAWRMMESWKVSAAITIDVMDKIRGTSSGILETWH